MSKTKEQIMNMPIYGNAYHDNPIFHAVHAYSIDESNSYTDRADVLEWMETQVMGCDTSRTTTDEEYVQSYLDEI